MFILSRKSRFRKLLSLLYSYPDPMQSDEDFAKLQNTDLEKMDSTQLCNEQQRVDMALAMVERDDIICLTSGGQLIFAEKWLTARKELIRRRLKGAGV